MIISTDITDRKQAEEELLDSLGESDEISEVTLEREKRLIELKKEINKLITELSRLRNQARDSLSETPEG